MNMDLHELNLIDLLSEKHFTLRKKVIDSFEEELNKTETHILAILEAHHTLSISEISRIINLSRQGAHKSVQGLLSRGYVRGVQIEDNLRDKYLTLTEKGLQANAHMLNIKQQLEHEITHKLGVSNVELLKKLLKEDWLES